MKTSSYAFIFLAFSFGVDIHAQSASPSLTDVRGARFEVIDEGSLPCDFVVDSGISPCADFDAGVAFEHIGFEGDFGMGFRDSADSFADDLCRALVCETYAGLESWLGLDGTFPFIAEFILWQHRSPTYCPDELVPGKLVMKLSRRDNFKPSSESTFDSIIDSAFAESPALHYMLSLEIGGRRSTCGNRIFFVFGVAEDYSLRHCKTGSTNFVALPEIGPVYGEGAKYIQVGPIGQKAPSTTDVPLVQPTKPSVSSAPNYRVMGIASGIILAALGAFAMFRMGRPTSK